MPQLLNISIPGVPVQAYHCNMTHPGSVVGNMAMLPLRTKYRGPAPLMAGDGIDVVDEALQYFKANVFFRTYEVKVSCSPKDPFTY